MSTFYFIFFIITGLPVITYPVVLMANIMSYAGHRPKNIRRLTVIMMKIFVWSTTLYPITYIFALYKYKNTPAESHYIWVGLILAHIFIIVLGFSGWLSSEKIPKTNDITSADSKEET